MTNVRRCATAIAETIIGIGRHTLAPSDAGVAGPRDVARQQRHAEGHAQPVRLPREEHARDDDEADAAVQGQSQAEVRQEAVDTRAEADVVGAARLADLGVRATPARPLEPTCTADVADAGVDHA